jgi:hypothetical protein
MIVYGVLIEHVDIVCWIGGVVVENHLLNLNEDINSQVE